MSIFRQSNECLSDEYVHNKTGNLSGFRCRRCAVSPQKFGYSIVKLLDPRLVKYRLSPSKAGPRVNGSLWNWHLQSLPRSHSHPTLTLLICSTNPHRALPWHSAGELASVLRQPFCRGNSCLTRVFVWASRNRPTGG